MSSATGTGVLNKFAGVYSWYEEYPTTPGSFVLNGFIYSLLGLHDLLETERIAQLPPSKAVDLYECVYLICNYISYRRRKVLY